MSAGVTRGAGRTRLGRWWGDWRFHLMAATVLIPALAFPTYYQQMRLFSGEAGLGARDAGVVQAGPFALRLAEFNVTPPQDSGIAGVHKAFTLALCEGCDDQIRAVYARFGKPRSLRAAGTIFSGPPTRKFADVILPARLSQTDDLWITVEEWDGKVHMVGVPISQASPVTLSWVEKRASR